ncbi:uncharacterized protein LOC108033334 [Drosophila biarmipes]|uniref:uncharacterized protein LOC108033334 n=1 Tax=Drosophila biarmipes TaxID=125945 RepID=UPI0007E89A2D|nr:uncharacterized protein LOC108033334 [Drosophila biarmipes]
MKYAYLLAICASLLLRKLETAATAASVGEPSQELKYAAQTIGLDEVGLRELWRTRQPLVIRRQSGDGLLTSETFELSPDGRSLSRKRVIEGSSPARLTDNSLSKPQEDWEYVPNTVRQRPSFGESHFGTGNFDTNIFGTGFPRAPLFPNWEVPAGVTPQVTTKTEVDNLGRKVTTTTRSYSGRVVPGSNVFEQLFPDISREPVPISPDLTQNPPIGAFGSNSGSAPSPTPRGPYYVPVIDPPTTKRTPVPLPTLTPPEDDGTDRVIDNFLEKLNLRTSDIENANGELVKTIVDKNGRVLTARFVLSTVKNPQEEPKPQPTK